MAVKVLFMYSADRYLLMKLITVTHKAAELFERERELRKTKTKTNSLALQWLGNEESNCWQ